MAKEPNNNKKKRFSIKIVLAFLIFEAIFTGITLPAYLFYGPFETAKKNVVGMLWESRRGPYVVNFFLAPEVIRSILSSGEDSETVTIGEGDENGGTSGSSGGDVTIAGKRDPNIDYKLIDGGDKYAGYLLIVNDPMRVKVAYSEMIPKQGELTSALAKKNNAIAAINAGGFVDYNFVSTGGSPMGYVIHEGKIAYCDNQTKAFNAMGITEEGKLITGTYSAKKMLSLKVKEAVCFDNGFLVTRGKGAYKKGQWSGSRQPRTAIGQRKSDGAILMLVIDGRNASSPGATLRDLQEIMLKFGAYTAFNLDGGSSSSMYYNDKVVSNASSILGERAVPTAIIVTK